MKTLMISPYSKKRPNGKPCAKNYPWWKELMALLAREGIKTVQIGIAGEEPIGAHTCVMDLPLETIKKDLQLCDGWVSVDNFLPHLGASLGKRGVVIFGPSDPIVFGHPSNINVLKDRKYLRPLQFATWHEEEMVEERFARPEEILKIILDYLAEKTECLSNDTLETGS
ncbi:MAG: glycosyltransferase family 9 protein [Gallionella sp.]|jgi:ADP-heptose:LPS heptosyltransferase